MIEDGLFSVNCGNAENLRAISVDAAKLCEKRLLELREVAEGLSSIAIELMSEGLSPLEAVSSVGEPDSPVYESHPFCLPENLHGVESFLSCVSDFDKAALCMLLPEALAEGGRTIRETDLLDCAPSEETVCYVRNAFSDEAFDVFSEGFSDPRVKYRASFKECASAVSDGQCGYLLLPLEERGGVRLPSVTEVLIRNDFKINAITPVFGLSLDADLKYALASKRFTVPEVNEGDDLYLELRLEKKSSLGSLMSALELFGHSVFRLNTVSVDMDGVPTDYFGIVLKDDGGRGFTALLLYLILFGEDYVTVGIYKNLE